jgi:YegS/Rv2252/BmrU family lipid kinase
MARTVLIVNPNARGGWLGRKWPTLEPVLQEELGPLEVLRTTRRGEGTALCREALSRGAELVLALGGDGTASEVAAGFLADGAARPAEGAPCFAFLPCGTGGDLRRTFDSPLSLREAARRVARAAPRRVDAGQLDCIGADGRPHRGHFINIASFGIGGLIDQIVNQSGKVLGGTATFFMASVRATLRYENARVRMTLDDGPPREGRVYSAAMANGRYFGGGMHVAPEARMDDGLFDVVTMGDLTFFEALALGRRIYRGAHLQMPKITHARARVIQAEPLCREPVLLDVDGETPGRLPATFTVLPGALWMRA